MEIIDKATVSAKRDLSESTISISEGGIYFTLRAIKNMNVKAGSHIKFVFAKDTWYVVRTFDKDNGFLLFQHGGGGGLRCKNKNLVKLFVEKSKFRELPKRFALVKSSAFLEHQSMFKIIV